MHLSEILIIGIKAAYQAGKEIMSIYTDPNADFKVESKSDNSPLTIADKKAHQVIWDYLQETNIPILSEEGKDIPFEIRKQWAVFWLVDPLDGTKEFIKKNGEFTVNIALINKNNPVSGIIYAPEKDTMYFSSELTSSCKSNYFSNSASKINTIENLMNNSTQISCSENSDTLNLVVSKSHMSKETSEYIEKIKKNNQNINYTSIGSSLKFCLMAEGKADIYPRFGPTMEWDTAAGHAIAKHAGCKITLTNEASPLLYNKEKLLNPWFIVKSKKTLFC